AGAAGPAGPSGFDLGLSPPGGDRASPAARPGGIRKNGARHPSDSAGDQPVLHGARGRPRATGGPSGGHPEKDGGRQGGRAGTKSRGGQGPRRTDSEGVDRRDRSQAGG